MRLIGQNNQYYIEEYNDQSCRLQPASGGSEVCHQAIPTSSAPTVWTAELGPTGNSQTGIKLFSTDTNGNKWYLRASLYGGAADLVCPDYCTHVSYFKMCLPLSVFMHVHEASCSV